jgi:hypothetical protein
MAATFDWYQGTVKAHPSQVLDSLMTLPGAHDRQTGRGRLNYQASTTVCTADRDTLATVLHGGNGGGAHVIGTGDNAQAVAATLRRWWPEHTVTRLDSADDLGVEFQELHAKLQAIGRDCGLKGRSIVPDDPEDGATYYLGADTSAVRARGYEKSKELAKKCGTWEGITPGIVRVEVQVRPVREGKAAAASWSPMQVFGASHWTRRIATELFEVDAPRVIMARRIPTTYERTHTALLYQFGPHLREMLARHGAWELVGEQLGDDLARRQEGGSCPQGRP